MTASGWRHPWQVGALVGALALVLVLALVLDWRRSFGEALGGSTSALAVAGWAAFGLPVLVLGLVGLHRRRWLRGRAVRPFRTPTELPDGVVLLHRVVLALSLVPVLVYRPTRSGNAELEAAYAAPFGLCVLLTILGAVVIEIASYLASSKAALAGRPSPAPLWRTAGSLALLLVCLVVGAVA